MKVNISQIAKALEEEHGDATTALLLALVQKNKVYEGPITYEDIHNTLKNIVWNLGLSMEHIITSAKQQEVNYNYNYEDYEIQNPTYMDYLQCNITLQKRTAMSFKWPVEDDHPEYYKVTDYIYETYYKPNFGSDTEYELKIKERG